MTASSMHSRSHVSSTVETQPWRSTNSTKVEVKSERVAGAVGQWC
jgi:hypothetical protein